MRIEFKRWTWPFSKKDRIFGKFGGGWNFKLGIAIGGNTIILDLIWGSVRIDKRSGWFCWDAEKLIGEKK